MTEWRNALAFAQGLVEHAIGAAGGGDVADELSLDETRGGGCGEEMEKQGLHDGVLSMVLWYVRPSSVDGVMNVTKGAEMKQEEMQAAKLSSMR
mmetsp:Transcript_17465/g.30714  ORF Transcript_17465/g.30714 Transcript_17465/m.30714 type:complete len:94 (+) Transcript_17465:972-1253(+)